MTRNAHFLDEQADEVLALLKVQGDEGGGNLSRGVSDAVAQCIVARQRGSLGAQGVLFVFESGMAVVDVTHPTLEFGAIDEIGLVEVHDAPPFATGSFDLAGKLKELFLDDLFGARGATVEHGMLGGE